MDINLQLALRTLKKVFPGDKDAQNALSVLEKKINAMTLEKTPKSTEDDLFPIPADIKLKNRAYALFCDGACRGNPGPGSWASMGQDQAGAVLFEIFGVQERTTNNQMEIQGAIEALSELKRIIESNELTFDCEVFLFSDSKYVVEGMESWVPGWKKRGWIKSDKKVPENLERWQKLDELKGYFPQLHFIWIKGHAGHPQNERCDQLANSALDEIDFI